MKSKKIKNFNIYDLIYLFIYLIPLLIAIGYVVFNVKSGLSYTNLITCLNDLLISDNNVIALALIELASYIVDVNQVMIIVCYLFSYLFIVEIIRLGFDFITFIFKFLRSFFERFGE